MNGNCMNGRTARGVHVTAATEMCAFVYVMCVCSLCVCVRCVCEVFRRVRGPLFHTFTHHNALPPYTHTHTHTHRNNPAKTRCANETVYVRRALGSLNIQIGNWKGVGESPTTRWKVNTPA